MTALLEIDGLSKSFGGLRAVNQLSFSVREREILGLIGPNGAGKSTVFNLINGVFPPDQGRVKFAGADLTGKPPYRVARHGLARTHQMRLLKSQRYDQQMQKWIGGDEDRRRAVANFQKYLALGGPYERQAREALASLSWK